MTKLNFSVPQIALKRFLSSSRHVAIGFVVGVMSVGLMVLSPGVVSGQDYPNKPIRIITTAAGGGNDFAARLIGQAITGPLGQPVIVDNRPLLLSAEVVAKAPPDGYTLLVGGNSTWIISLLQKAPYDAVKDFAAISLISRDVFILVVHPSVPVKSIKELIALAKARPGELNYASTTIGGAGYLGGALLKSMAGINIVGISYKGSAATITALLSGEVHLMITPSSNVMRYVKSGKMRALAVTTAMPSVLAPGLPTVAASGLPGYEAVSTTGSFAPANTPVAIIVRLNQEMLRVLNRADVKERFLNAGAETVGSSPEEFAAMIKSDIVTMGKVIKDAGIKPE